MKTHEMPEAQMRNSEAPSVRLAPIEALCHHDFFRRSGGDGEVFLASRTGDFAFAFFVFADCLVSRRGLAILVAPRGNVDYLLASEVVEVLNPAELGITGITWSED